MNVYVCEVQCRVDGVRKSLLWNRNATFVLEHHRLLVRTLATSTEFYLSPNLISLQILFEDVTSSRFYPEEEDSSSFKKIRVLRDGSHREFTPSQPAMACLSSRRKIWQSDTTVRVRSGSRPLILLFISSTDPIK